MKLTELGTFYRMAHKFIDIGANLTDNMYNGIYNGKKKHDNDLDEVLKRSWKQGIEKIIITGSSMSDSQTALKLCENNDKLFCTVGCHPTNCDEFEKDGEDSKKYLDGLLQLVLENKEKVVAIGECGLDYERTNFCSVDVQKKYFEKQISLAKETGLPMFLHCRNAASDLVSILKPYRDEISGGVVHSFDGSIDDMKQILQLNLYIGINGCSLKTEENLSVASQVPLDRLMIETDSPWCEIKPSHAGFQYVETKFASKKKEKWAANEMIKGRNEPSCIVQVLEILAAIRKANKDSLSDSIYYNSSNLFFLNR